MRKVRLMTKKDFDWNMKQIDEDYKEGLISREEAKRARDKIKHAYKTNKVNRDIVQTIEQSSTMKL